jgi:hypothetical protein
MSEGHVVKACIQLLILWKCDIIRNNTGAVKTEHGAYLRFGKKGSGDILALSPHGRWVELECKFGRGATSPEQDARQKLVQSMGGVYLFVRNNTAELEAHKNRILAIPQWSHP